MTIVARRAARIAAVVALIVLIGYAALLGGLYAVQDRLFYPGWSRDVGHPVVDASGYRLVAVRTADGLAGRLRYRPARPGRATILFLHGNGDSTAGGVVALQQLVAAGYGAAIPEYRGFDGLPGHPNEAGLYEDARAARTWLAGEGVGAEHTILMGYSLGTGVAAQLAAEASPRALVLIAPYSSMADVVRDRLPWVPGFLVSERFETAGKIARLTCPILLLHGALDRTVPPVNSARLLAVQPRAERIVLRGVGHEAGFLPGVQAIVLRWLRARGA